MSGVSCLSSRNFCRVYAPTCFTFSSVFSSRMISKTAHPAAAASALPPNVDA